MILYKVACPLCDHVVKCHDSMSDARQELGDHLLAKHPDAPDPTHDPRFPSWNNPAPKGSSPSPH